MPVLGSCLEWERRPDASFVHAQGQGHAGLRLNEGMPRRSSKWGTLGVRARHTRRTEHGTYDILLLFPCRRWALHPPGGLYKECLEMSVPEGARTAYSTGGGGQPRRQTAITYSPFSCGRGGPGHGRLAKPSRQMAPEKTLRIKDQRLSDVTAPKAISAFSLLVPQQHTGCLQAWQFPLHFLASDLAHLHDVLQPPTYSATKERR